MNTEDCKVLFCWHCGRKLRFLYKAEVEIDGHLRTLHKGCVELAKNNEEHGCAGGVDWGR